jgi:hypothetical protein
LNPHWILLLYPSRKKPQKPIKPYRGMVGEPPYSPIKSLGMEASP